MDSGRQKRLRDAAEDSSSPTPSTSGSTAAASTSGSSKRLRATGDTKQGYSLEQLYPRGKVFVFPIIFKLEKEVGEPTKDEMPRDPKEYLASSEKSQGTLPRRLRMAHKADKEHLQKKEGQTKGYHAEYCVNRLLLSHLQEKTKGEDLPSFVLHNMKLGGEKDILVLSRKFGVVIVEVKGVDEQGVLKERVEKGERQLLQARGIAREKSRGLVKPESVTIVLALPNMPKSAISDVRKHLKNEDVELLVGQEARVYQELLEGLGSRADSDVWDTSSPDMDSADTAFKMTAEKFLSAPRISKPVQPLEKVAGAHNRWLLTQEQMDIRDDTAKFLHIWGPPGAGKTLLLLHNAIRRLEEDEIVIVASGSWKYDLLESHFGRAALREQKEKTKNLHICRTNEEIGKKLKEMEEMKEENQKICLFIDELHDRDVFRTVVEAVKSKTVRQSWSADVNDLPHMGPEPYEEAKKEGWESVHLAESIRCPKEIIELLNRLSLDAPVQACRIPRPGFLTDGKEVVDHAPHAAPGEPSLSRELECSQCRKKLTEALDKDKDKIKRGVPKADKSSSDGLHEQARDKNEYLRQWVVLGTGERLHDERDPALRTGGGLYDGLRDLASSLREMEIHAVCEGSSNFLRSAGVVMDPSQSSNEADIDAMQHRERVAAGLESSGKPAVHVVWGEFFQGLEKPGVVMVHWDEKDFHPDQTEAARTARQDVHRRAWFQAASRCQGRLVIWLLSPSPARSLLGLPPVQIPPGPGLAAAEGPHDFGAVASTSTQSSMSWSSDETEMDMSPL